MAETPVVIAGGGIAGLSAALAISRAGRDVLVFERDDACSGEGAGLQLSPNASRHLRTWGVLDRLDATALTPRAVVVRRSSDARRLSALDLGDAERRFGAPFRLAHRADLHDALRKAVADEPRIAVRDGVSVTGWSDQDSLAVETTTGAQHAAALIIADGVHSRLRERIDATPLLVSGRVAWRALIPADRCEDFARERTSNLWLGPRAHLVHYPLRGGSVVNVVAIVGDDPPLRSGERSGEDRSWSQPGDPETLAARFRDWSPQARDLLAAASSWRIWPLFARNAPSHLTQGRVALVGDAAHPMMPFLAQGAAQAIEDAAALGTAFAHQNATGAALANYESMRLLRVKRVVAASERQTMIYHLDGAAARVRDIAMHAGGSAAMQAMTNGIYGG